jgi:hypothetical protein
MTSELRSDHRKATMSCELCPYNPGFDFVYGKNQSLDYVEK